jgi:hypothetical protein
MQVLLKKSDEKQDVNCPTCGQGFRLYWERTSLEERNVMLATVLEELQVQHASDVTSAAHPDAPFNVPRWTGPANYSGAALLGGLSGFHKIATPEMDYKRNN